MIHFLNVKEGDCSVIQHKSRHVTVIDISNGNAELKGYEECSNYNQKANPTNPIMYIKKLGIDSIFRFVLTHPDMDHMDGIKKLFSCFDIENFWDTENNKIIKDDNWGQYCKEDWDYYQFIRKSSESPKTLKLHSGAKGKYYYDNSEENMDSDGLLVLAPNNELVEYANTTQNYNNISYVILYQVLGKKILFAGDSEEKTWDYILNNYSEMVKDIDVLIAPHHGRKTGGNKEYLDVLKPKLTLFGNAKSDYLDYSSWNNRNLRFITNNEAGNVILLPYEDRISIYCSNEKYAKAVYSPTFYYEDYDAWFIGLI